MKQNEYRTKSTAFQRFLGLLLLISTSTTSLHASDWVLNESQYSASQSGDHLYLEVFLADLDYSNTYSKGGHVYATNGIKTIDLMYLEYINQGDDESQTAEVKAYLVEPNARAWFTNSQMGNQQISTSNSSYWLTKWGSDHHYMTAKIDFYYPSELAGGTWKIYYNFKHSNNSWYTKVLHYGCQTSSTLGMSPIDASQYTCERTSPNNIKFSVPKLPDDIPSKVNDVRTRYCTYNVSYIYYKQDGSKETIKETYECDKMQAKSFTHTTPETVGNPMRIDLQVSIRQGVKDPKGDFWSTASYYNKTDVFPVVPVPGSITTEFRQFDNTIVLSWPQPVSSNHLTCTPYLYRIETDANGNIPSGRSWGKRGTVDNAASNSSLSFNDDGVQMGINYKYMVVNVPKEWIGSTINTSMLNNPSDDLLKKLAYTVSNVITTSPTLSIYNLQRDTTITDEVRLTWEYSRIPTDAATVTFKVMRKTDENATWSELGTVNGTSQPSAGTVLSFVDNTLPNPSVRYQYKVVLSLVNGKYEFESDPIFAGYLSGSSVKSFSATKGTHEATVRLSWKAKQVGTDNTSYVISRRYVNTGADFMQIYTTNGTAEQYTYEDNTVQPGYYYEYKIETYSGNLIQNTLYDVGFCQARGVISGRVTFGTGSAVEDVRLSLLPSNTGDDNTVRGYSQRVEGASTGIMWDADSAEVAKVFGEDKDYTVQMFIRPDEGMAEGAVIGEIPGWCRLLLGGQTGSDYELELMKVMPRPAIDLSTVSGDFVARDNDVLTGTLRRNVKISIADGATVLLRDVTINRPHDYYDYDYTWAGISCEGDATILLSGDNHVKGFSSKYPGIYIPSGKTVTIKGDGSLRAESNGSGAGIGGGYNKDCGNIVIEGGSITASGGTSVSAIGVGGYGSCGNITISSGVTSITAINKMGANYANIGGGDHGTCGVVTIGDVVYFDGQNYQNGGERVLVNFPYTYRGNGSGSVPMTVTPTSYVEGREATGLKVPVNTYSLLSVSRSGDNLSVQLNRDEAVTLTAKRLEGLSVFSVGGASGITAEQAFRGHFTEVRVWNHALTEKELKSHADRVLNGREQGLMLYWPMDEGLERYVFDASYANDMPNGRHATVGNNIVPSSIIPTDAQLSRYATTNENGEYIIRGIPFVGSGSTYTILPTRGIHEFSPQSRNGFIGNGNLTLNAYDFTDVSSFPVRGKVTYLNTNIPVDSVQFMIDGNLVQSKEGVHSDANGEFEISVPIGEHLLECYMMGHRFTSFPLDGSKYDFKRSEVVNFVDSTLVNVTGRINGGFSDQNEPVGFHRSKNRIGKATIKLSLGKESQCSFNYIVDDHGDGSFGKVNIPVESATDSIKSTAYRSGSIINNKENKDNTNYIFITTDEKTGEFSAMLPPLKYKVESIEFVGGDDYNNESVFAQNLPMIDASNAIEEKMKQDSIVVGNYISHYKYSAKMIRQLRARPTISVVQRGQKNGAFGEKVIPVTNIDNSVDSVQVVRFTEQGGYEYIYGHPLFRQGRVYNFDIDVYEGYKNLDTGEEFKEVPRDAVFNIMNDASGTTTIYGEKATINGEEVEVGEAYSTLNIQATPDEKGHIGYQWEGGFPNLARGNLRNLSIGVKIDGRTTMWQAPDSRDEALDLIILGGIGTGKNFVTAGPENVDMIIRRPPGSTSVASLTDKTITSYGHTTILLNNSDKIGGGLYMSETPTFEIDNGTVIAGIALINNSKWKFVSQQTIVTSDTYSDKDVEVNDSTYSVTEAMTTPSSIPIDLETMSFVPEGGDTYIGRSTNLIFSKGRILGLFKQDDGSFALGEKDGITISESFGTKFAYPQAYILNTLIPNWEAIIRSKLEEGHINADHWNLDNLPKVPGKVIYYTKYSPGDEQFGKANGDTDYWSNQQLAATDGYPSYRMVDGTEAQDANDEVEYAINQIKLWRERIADNEQDKIDAFGDADNLIENYSIASGTKVSQTTETSRKTGRTHSHTYTFTENFDRKYGPLVNDAGVNLIFTNMTTEGDGFTNDTLTTRSRSVAWTMSDGDVRTALSVDVYRSPSGWGPIFRTRGGQTANPYESASYSRFYNKGTLLNEGTMRIENPQLKVIGSPEITDVPMGGQAIFTLQLSNQSETNDICTYVLQALDRSNPSGAILTIDGNILSNGKDGRRIKMKGGETVLKTLIVTQSNRSITDYEDIVLQLKSENDPSIESEKVTLRVHFVPASAHVDLSTDHTILNKEYLDDNSGITATMSNLDRQDEGLQGLRLRFRRKGVDTWNVIKQWATTDSLINLGYERMLDGSTFDEKVSFPEDGIYELQAQTFGANDVTYESNIVEVTQDTHGPKILGMVSPENGQLTYTNRNNMHLRFNEVLNGNALSKSDNFRIEGGMNNVVFGESKYPDVAVQLNGDRIGTDALYNLTNTDYAFDMWFFRQGDGTIISLGTDNNLLSLSTHDDGMLQARVGDDDDVYDTNVQLPANKWVYMALNYKRKSATDPENRITMLYATAEDKEPKYIGQNVPAKDLDGHGKLSIGGDGMQGMVAELSVWNSDVTAKQLYETRTMSRAAYTPGLVGYWDMTEGHGTQITDIARSRHMRMPSESWYINNENRATRLSGEEDGALKIDITTFNPAKTDNYAYEMWFRGNDADNTGQATLLSVMNGTVKTTEKADSILIDNDIDNEKQYQYIYKHITAEQETTIGFDEGKMKMKFITHETSLIDGESELVENRVVKSDILLTEKNYLDGNWHHLAFNVRRGTSAIAYIDGEAVKVLAETAVPGISSRYLMVGGELTPTFGSTNRFKGDVDEIRIWNAALDGKLIGDRMYERMTAGYPGLVGYFPMEEIHRTSQGTVVTEFSTANFGEKDSRLKMEGTAEQSVNAPALKPGSTKMRLDDSQFNFTASADEIYFTFPDSALPLMDNNDFVATVNYIKDEHGNNSETVSWTFHTDFAAVKWREFTLFDTDISKPWNDVINWTEIIYNTTGSPQSYEISGLPSWITVDKPVGTIDGDMAAVTFTIGTDVPVGRYTEYVYLTDRLGIRRVMQINLTVMGDEPDWKVNPDLYESNMIMTGQIYIDDKISEFTDSKIAAFDDMGICRGVASPEYVSTRDAFYVNMIVYGASATELSDGVRDLTFKMYDASTGNTYPIVNVTLPGKEPSTIVRYAPDAIYGSYDTPVVFATSDLLQQTITLPAGWSWMSIYVQPTSTAISDVLPKTTADRKKFQNIKSHDAIASVKTSDASVLGSLKEITPGNMYKVQVSAKVNYDLVGSLINVRNTEATIHSGWNWIGPLSANVMSLKDAFADLNPEAGDVVKTRTAFASYRGDGRWEGTLQSIIPGMGYIYNSKAPGVKTFHYPFTSNTSLGSHNKAMALRAADESQRTVHYNPVDNHLYPDNMNIIAVVKMDGTLIENAELGAFVNGECRGATECDNGYYFLTILGSSADDIDNRVEIRVCVEGEEYAATSLSFASDAIYGTLENPYVIDLDATAITTIEGNGNDDDDNNWYSLQGFKLPRKPTKPGVYIHNGKKVTVRPRDARQALR